MIELYQLYSENFYDKINNYKSLIIIFHFILHVLKLARFLTPLDIMLGLMAAAAHDVDHPGVNQPFLIKTKHHLASLYQVKIVFFAS